MNLYLLYVRPKRDANGSGEKMKLVKLYYNPTADYDSIENTNANIWISIDDMSYLDPIIANKELIKGEALVTPNEEVRHDPVGIFSLNTAARIEYNGKVYGFGAEIIGYKTITPEALKQKLEDRVSKLGPLMKYTDIKFECIRGDPPRLPR
jgi:hypothetical protein